MADRLCGYCRVEGHMRPACPELHEKRKLILTYTPVQRLKLIETLGKVGLGIGATFRGVNQWDNDKEFIGTIHSFDFVQQCNFVEATSLRYSKKVKLTTLDIEKDYFYRRIYINYLQMSNGVADYRNLGVSVTALFQGRNGQKRVEDGIPFDVFNRQIDLFAPSNDITFDSEVLVNNISMPKRLMLKDDPPAERMRGHMPTQIT